MTKNTKNYTLDTFLDQPVSRCNSCGRFVQVINDRLVRHSVMVRISEWDGGDIPECVGSNSNAGKVITYLESTKLR